MKTNRRVFLKTMGGLALFTVVPRQVLGKGFLAPSDQLTKGIIGVGSMGRNHLNYGGARLTAICDVDKNHLAQGQALVSGKMKEYDDFRALIHDPDVDIVHIATPPHWHGIMSVEAARAGKAIWCETPMTRTIGEGMRVMEAVKKYNVIFRLNTGFRFAEPFYGLGTSVRPVKKLVQSGLLGWPLKVIISENTGFSWDFSRVGKVFLKPEIIPSTLDYDKWLGPAPYKMYNAHRVHQTFRGYWDYDGGVLGDCGQQYLDPVQYILDKDEISPVKVEVDAPQQHPDAVGVWRSVIYTYDDGCQIILRGCDDDKQDSPFITGPNGNVYKNFVCDIPGWERKLAGFREPDAQRTDFVKCINTRQPFALNERNGFRSATLVNMGLVALRLNRTLRFDSVKLQFIDDDAANRLLDQPMRAPWSI